MERRFVVCNQLLLIIRIYIEPNLSVLYFLTQLCFSTSLITSSSDISKWYYQTELKYIYCSYATMYETAPILHPVRTYPWENTNGRACALYPEFDVKIFLSTPYALKDLNTEALLEDAGATLLKNITLYQQQWYIQYQKHSYLYTHSTISTRFVK